MSRLSRSVAAAALVVASLAGGARAHAQQQAPPSPASPSPAPVARGAITGQVIDKATGRPLPFATVTVVGTQLGAQADLDGRYRILSVPAGLRVVRALRIGYTPLQFDSVRVTGGGTTTLNIALSTAAVALQGVRVQAAAARASSEDALLAMRKSAANVSDGISAEEIGRAPGSDAADAITRVTGVSVVDDKFVVVRGLSERYSNTLLNGVELTSPEPLKKIVPLDLFPASLLESIVTNKTATPDKPGDFAGGSVEITTKEFPDRTVVEGSLSVGMNTIGTLERVAQLPQRGNDWFGFDAGRRRAMPARPPLDGDPDMERFAEQLRNEWTPAPTRVLPDLGGGLTLGGRVGTQASPLGYVTSLTYSRSTDYNPSRLSQLVFDDVTGVADVGYVATEATNVVDLGAIANFTYRLGAASKIGWKNLYTRNAEEMLARNVGFETYNGPAERIIYQARYITRELVQTQLTGDHLIGLFANSRLAWKGTMSQAARDEPENRSLVYFKNTGTGVFTQGSSAPSPYWFRFLDDRLYSGQVDWSLPVPLPRGAEALLKTGGLMRRRDREFDAYYYRMGVAQGADETGVGALPPEQSTAPENVGATMILERPGVFALPYESDDDVNAAYAMLDTPLPLRLRLTGGVRVEGWHLNLFQGRRDVPLGEPTRKYTRDWLWSGNLVLRLGERQNLRLAAYRTLARPDPREVSPDFYVAVTGDCANRGNPEVDRSRILNGDVRWEWFPAAGELASVSLFYKRFERPIVELLSLPGSSVCVTNYVNADRAKNLGAELELRRSLDFLPGDWSRFSLGLNVTLVDTEAEYRPVPARVQRLPLTGQSDYVGNASVFYTNPDRGLQASLLVNAFGDRVVRYGVGTVLSDTEIDQVPNVIERGRVTVDAKVQQRIGSRLTASLSGRNLTDAEVRFHQGSQAGDVRTGYDRPGVQVSLGVGYALR